MANFLREIFKSMICEFNMKEMSLAILTEYQKNLRLEGDRMVATILSKTIFLLK